MAVAMEQVVTVLRWGYSSVLCWMKNPDPTLSVVEISMQSTVAKGKRSKSVKV